MTVVRRYGFSDQDWAEIEPLLPRQERGGKWNDHRTVMNGMFWVLRSGSAWRDMPERYGKWQTVYDRFNRWRRDGTWARILDALLLRLDRAGGIDRDLWCVDATISRAHVSAAGARKKSRPAAAIGRAPGGANDRAAGPCAGALAGRLQHQDASGL